MKKVEFDFDNVIKKMAKIWDKIAIVEKAITPSKRFSEETISNILLSKIPEKELKKATLLDVGCGEGRITESLAKKVNHYVGIDVSETVLNRARNKTKTLDNVKFFHIDKRLKYLFEKETFQIVISWAVFPHMPKEMLRIYLDDIYTIMDSKGYFNFQPDDYPSLIKNNIKRRFDKIQNYFNETQSFWRARWYPEWLMGYYIIEAGFKIEGLPEEEEQCWRVRK